MVRGPEPATNIKELDFKNRIRRVVRLLLLIDR